MSEPSKSTMVELVEELQKLPRSADIDHMIEEARAGEYHDFKNQKYICGKLESSQRLRSLGYHELADRIESGEFDEEPDAEDDARISKDLGEGLLADAFRKILGINNEC